MRILATRTHEFSYGHRVYGHESKCAHLHGHNGKVHFTLERRKTLTDAVGRTLDFGAMKKLLCGWVEDNWDHRFLISRPDPWGLELQKLDDTVVIVPFNPTAENMAKYLLEIVGPAQLRGTGTELIEVVVEETSKCLARARL